MENAAAIFLSILPFLPPLIFLRLLLNPHNTLFLTGEIENGSEFNGSLEPKSEY